MTQMLESAYKNFKVAIITMLKNTGNSACKKLHNRNFQQRNRTIKKRAKGKLRKENIISEKEYHMARFIITWEMTEEKVNEHEDISIESIQSEGLGEK